MKKFGFISHALSYPLAFAAIAAVGACAHERAVSPEQLSAAEAPLRAAQEAGAEKVPAGALHLKLAREEITLAKTLAAKGDKRAATVFGRAQADAELALALAQEATLRGEAKTLSEEATAAKLK